MDKEAFADRVVALEDVLYRVSYTLLPNPEDQKDAVQECLRKAFQKHESLRDDDRLQGWLVRILVNECYNVLRQKKRIMPVEEVVVTVPPKADPFLNEALMSLAPKHRLPLVLHYIEGYGISEIGRILRLPEGTVKTRMARARKLLKAMLEAEEVYG